MIGAFMLISLSMSAGGDWALSQESDSVKVFYKVVDCATGKSIILKIENASKQDANVVFDVFVTIDGQKINESGRMVVSHSESSIEGQCDRPTNQLTVLLPFPGEEISVEVKLNN